MLSTDSLVQFLARITGEGWGNFGLYKEMSGTWNHSADANSSLSSSDPREMNKVECKRDLNTLQVFGFQHYLFYQIAE